MTKETTRVTRRGLSIIRGGRAARSPKRLDLNATPAVPTNTNPEFPSRPCQLAIQLIEDVTDLEFDFELDRQAWRPAVARLFDAAGAAPRRSPQRLFPLA
jgi:hypothetical protein